jgi:hypothetical protein
MSKRFTYVREIKSGCKYAVQRVVVFCNGIHVSVYRVAKPAFYVITRGDSHLKHITQCNDIPNLITPCLQQTDTSEDYSANDRRIIIAFLFPVRVLKVLLLMLEAACQVVTNLCRFELSPRVIFAVSVMVFRPTVFLDDA